MPDLSIQEWHDRYTQQARWTAHLRRYLLGKARMPSSARILEVGCGTGAVLVNLQVDVNPDLLIGLDINSDVLQAASIYAAGAQLIQGDALRLPFSECGFDTVFCHFLLLWLKKPQFAIQEMVRVLRPGGSILALAEPDYGGRIDFPTGLVKLGQLQTKALLSQGADPHTGRKLAGWFSAAGLSNIEYGVLGGQWTTEHHPDEWLLEWSVLEADLAGSLTHDELTALKEQDLAARLSGERLLFVPTCYAYGQRSD